MAAGTPSGGGQATATYSYDVFGAIRSESGTGSMEFRFTGEQRDPQGNRNFYYLRARYYDPATGRFLSQDPLPTGNLYVYVGNNPVNFVDPSGAIGVPGIVDTGWECATDPVDCGEEGVDTLYNEVVEPVAEETGQFLLNPNTLATLGQAVGSVAINAGCPTGAVIVCAAGLTLYTYSSVWKISMARDSSCEALVQGLTSYFGGLLLPTRWARAGFLIATLSGIAEAIACPSAVYATAGGGHYRGKE